MEKLPSTAMDKISKKSKQFCEQLAKVQSELVDKRKREQGEGVDSHKAENEISQDSSFYRVLYGPDSTLDADPFIQEIMSCLTSHSDLKKQFKRFLPDDDEDEIKNIEEKVIRFRQNLNLEQIPMGTELDVGHQEEFDNSAIQHLKRESYDSLFRNLTEYAEVREKQEKQIQNKEIAKQMQERVKLYSEKIMLIAETYQKYVKDELD